MATQTLTAPLGVAQTYNPSTGTFQAFNSPAATVSPLSSSYSAGTNAGGSTTKSLTNDDTVSGTVPDTGSALSDSLSAQFAPTQNTIMQNYAASNSALSAAAGTNAQSITDTGNYNLGYENTQDKNLGTQQLEGRSGFVTNPGAIVALQTQADKRVRDLTTQMNDALANNNSELASSLASNVASEQTAITNARTAFLSQYFGAQQEARSEASFQTPEQQQVFAMSSQYPDAGITPQDTLAQAQTKVQANSKLYKLGLTATQAGITASNAGAQASLASAGLSSAQAAQLNTVLQTLKTNGSYDSDIASLLNNSATDATLHAKYDSYPGGLGGAIIASIEGQAQAQGWNAQQSSLNAQGAKTLTETANSGGIGAVGAGFTSLLSNAAEKIFGDNAQANPFTLAPINPASPFATGGKTPSGISYTITQ